MRTQRLFNEGQPWYCLFLLWLSALMAALSACHPIVPPTPVPVTTEAQLPTIQPTAAGNEAALAGTQTVARLYVFNRTDTPICYVYISPVAADAWGEDRLDADEVIAPDGRRTFRLRPGRYDLLARDCDAEPMAEQDDVSIRAFYRWVVTGSAGNADATSTPKSEATPTPRPARHPTATPVRPTATATPYPLPTLPALDAYLCCGVTPGETGTLWSVRYPAAWTVSRLPDNPQEFYGAIFHDPNGRVAITFIPGANTEPGHWLDTGDVDLWLDRFTQQRRREAPGFTEFLREPVPGVSGGRLWAGVWGHGADRGWEGYLVVVNPLLMVAPGMPQGYLTLYGLRATSRDWNNTYTLYEQMFNSMLVKRTGGAWQGVPLGEPSQKPFMVRWCPTTCDWMAVYADSPDWIGDCGEPTTLWETVCRPTPAP